MRKIVDDKLNILKNVMCARSPLVLEEGDVSLFRCNGNFVCATVQEALEIEFREEVSIYRIRDIEVLFHYGLEGTPEEMEEFKKLKR